MADSGLGRDKADVASMIRVNQAGEYGAAQIYKGQLAVMGDDAPHSSAIHHMAEQEQRHLDAFDQMIVDRAVRPTILQPFWKVAGYALGAGTAAMGPRAAMACTAAVETEIDRHYQEQLEQLESENEPALAHMIADFREEELEHKETALAAGAEDAPGYPILSAAIRLGCRAAIGLSKRI
ncbi:demethoxyubiquinone hydroxylase family protein [Parasphingorhabdus sp.]|jgi:ubiquinone biosynthesis monooxygenase Coq7|uniref:demethoxyubiquinone hydroxylase family protein n=1 Tax=Parasphingorhabdus sp. TaxID=2709688 RepID=UPI0007F4A404|nr:ubiquinone biosynthesis protein UbiB [Sphingomonadales bacterium EhC05]